MLLNSISLLHWAVQRFASAAPCVELFSCKKQKPPRLQATQQELDKFRQSSSPSTPVEPVDNNTQRKQYPPLESPAR
jgi:hypothetical protein